MTFDPEYYYITYNEADTISGSLYNGINDAFSTFSGTTQNDIDSKAITGHTHPELVEKMISLSVVSGTGYTTISGSTDLAWGTQIRKDDIFSHTLSGTEITVTSGGLYNIDYNINIENIVSQKIQPSFVIKVNDVAQQYTTSYGYSTGTTYPYVMANKHILMNLNPGDVIKISRETTASGGASSGWYDLDWQYRKSITIDGDQVETASGGSITFDDSSTSSNPSSASTKSWSHTISGNDNRLLVVTIAFENSSSLSVSSVTYDGVAMTPGDSDSVSSGFFQFGAIYYMLEADLPSTGSYTVQVNLSGSASSMSAGAMSFYGVDQDVPEDTSTETDTGTAVISTPITTTSDNALIVTAISDGNTYSHTPNSSQTEEYDIAANSLSYCAGWLIRSSPGSGEIQWTSSSSTNRLVHVLLSFAPAPAGGGSITDYPMYFQGGFVGAKSDGTDILFTDEDNNKLDHEIENWDAGGSYFKGWIRIPTLSGGVDTTLYTYYGNLSATDQSNPTGVWDDDFMAVWHLNENFSDSTGNTSDGSATGTVIDATGQMAAGKDFEGASGADYVTVSHDADLQPTNAVTMECWANADDVTSGQKLFGKFDLTNGYLMGIQGGGIHPEVEAQNNNHAFIAGTISVDTWTYLAATWEVDGSLIGYINNTTPSSVAAGALTMASNTDDFIMGAAPWDTSFYWFNGTLDEVRLSSVARGTDYLYTSFNNQNSPATFYAVGDTEQGYITILVDEESTITIKLLRYS